MAAIFKNGRHLLMHNLTSGRQGDYGRWAPGLSSAPCLPSPPRCVAGSIAGSWSNLKFQQSEQRIFIIVTGRPAIAQPCLYGFYVKFCTGERRERPLPRAKLHIYRGKNVGIQPPKLSKFRILARNLYLRGDSFAVF